MLSKKRRNISGALIMIGALLVITGLLVWLNWFFDNHTADFKEALDGKLNDIQMNKKEREIKYSVPSQLRMSIVYLGFILVIIAAVMRKQFSNTFASKKEIKQNFKDNKITLIGVIVSLIVMVILSQLYYSAYEKDGIAENLTKLERLTLSFVSFMPIVFIILPALDEFRLNYINKQKQKILTILKIIGGVFLALAPFIFEDDLKPVTNWIANKMILIFT